ncbi:hypothetical protein PDESU_05995 [Pontiella desulfatans]|uniref:STAS/SEC14 domain-containing protein n=1 Tax=Pontiella desulfatans TaxID=2750659 RepID=A0A6C2UBT7_PONDE|nr:hypothetical protein [Pontiella desulfatans]VGO17399.1 hypothetical protein PDESU_05995 [Pontiella desulfatans]
MPVFKYRLVFEDRGFYLYAHLTGEDSFAASLSYWNEIADKVRELDYRKVLVHEDLMGETDEAEIFDIMMDILPSSTGIQVAFFDENQTNAEINEFGHLIATNRGADIRIFQSLDDARNWIEQTD